MEDYVTLKVWLIWNQNGINLGNQQGYNDRKENKKKERVKEAASVLAADTLDMH